MLGPDKQGVALGAVKPNLGPALRVTGTFPAVTVKAVHAFDTGGQNSSTPSYVFDFGQNMAGMVTLQLPAGHGIPAGTTLRIEHAEIVQGKSLGIGEMCRICPTCSPCITGPAACDASGLGAACDTYCKTGYAGSGNASRLRHEPCFPHQSYAPGYPTGGLKPHETLDRYVGDFNNANMTNIYVVGSGESGGGGGGEETYTAFFAGAGFRYAQLSGLPAHFGVPSASMLTARRVHSAVAVASHLHLPNRAGTTFGTPDILQRMHNMTLAAQVRSVHCRALRVC